MLLLAATTAQGANAQCLPPKHVELANVQHVHDGDTLILEDRRKLRLLGYNTPEVARHPRPAEPLAEEARQQLSLWIESSHNEIRLQYDHERTDHYGRTLAHVFLKDGRSIAALMLQSGFATNLIIPPNLQHADCYLEAETRARRQQLGVWALSAYQVAKFAQLKSHRNRYTVLQAMVSTLEQDAEGYIIWLGGHEFTPQIQVRINTEDIALFPYSRLKNLIGKTVEIRGWLHHRDKTWTLRLRHPSNLQILQTN